MRPGQILFFGGQMTVIEQILNGINKGKALYEREPGASEMTAAAGAGSGADSEDRGDGDTAQCRSELFLGDNLEYMNRLVTEGYAGSFSLIYIDPPFFTKSKFNATVDLRDAGGKTHKIHHLAYDDRFDRNLEYYVENMTVRLLMMRDLLADDGLMWVHLDWHSAHYIKLVMDELMGEKNFVNEIIWCYKSGGSGKRHFARKHDTILVYSKTEKYYIEIPEEKSYNRGRKPYRFSGVEEFRDDYGWYTMVNMKDVWNIDMVGRTSGERTGYATQKPLELMKRIVASSSREDGLVGDFFCGSGSLLEAAQLLGRSWKGCDSEELAVSMARKRLSRAGADFSFAAGSSGRAEEGRADVEVLSKEMLEDGRYFYSCRIAEFLPDIDTGYIQLSDRQYVEAAIEDDPVQFVDYICADGKLINVDSANIQFIAGDDADILITDVFGREYKAELHQEA